MADVVIIGAGPCGLAAAVALRRASIPAVVFDKACLVSSIAGYPTYTTFFSTPDKLEIGGIPFTIMTEKPTRRDGLAYYRMVAESQRIALRLYEGVERVEARGTAFVVHSRRFSGDVHTTPARAVIIATGYFDSPNLLGVPGEDLPHVTHRFIEGHEAFGRDALVVGGGNSAVECALELHRCGARVTLVHFGPTFDHVIKPWILPEFDRLATAGDIRVRWNARVTCIGNDTVELSHVHGRETVPAQHVYLMTGYTPTPGLLGDLGVPFDRTSGVPDHDPQTMETSVRGVFIAGVIASGNDANSVFIENGRDHGALIATELSRR
jgi:thioredoxin reductase (NADPH)